MNYSINCNVITSLIIFCNGTEFRKYEPMLNMYDLYFWIYLAIYVLLTIGAGLMSGLTLGLLSLDTLTLEVLMRAGIGSEAKYAEKLYPIIKHHHILLVTLLLGNAACVESMPIFLDRISSPIIAIIVSVTAVLIFGEIIPQALCKRYGLAIGYYLRPLVYFLMAITIFVAYPISLLLDCIFGQETGIYYQRSQLKALIDLHGPSNLTVKSMDTDENVPTSSQIDLINSEEKIPRDSLYTLSIEEVTVIKGALDMTTKTAKDGLVALENVFMLSDTITIDHEHMRQIRLMAHSRIPVYLNNERCLIRGILITKMLIDINPESKISIRTLIQDHMYFQPLSYVTETTPLYDLLKLFKTGKTGHMAVVVKDDIDEIELDALEKSYTIQEDLHKFNLISVLPPVLGIITLEDVIEKLIQSEIKDESDIHRHISCRNLLRKQKLRKLSYEYRPSRKRTISTIMRQQDSDILNKFIKSGNVLSTSDVEDKEPIVDNAS